MAGKGGKPHPGKGGEGPDETGRTLRARYKTMLVDKLTREDLADLKISLENQFDERHNLNLTQKRKFEGTLRRYLHEEVLTREIIGIEALIRSLKPEDLRR
jgi:hypothetical protein